MTCLLGFLPLARVSLTENLIGHGRTRVMILVLGWSPTWPLEVGLCTLEVGPWHPVQQRHHAAVMPSRRCPRPSVLPAFLPPTFQQQLAYTPTLQPICNYRCFLVCSQCQWVTCHPQPRAPGMRCAHSTAGLDFPPILVHPQFTTRASGGSLAANLPPSRPPIRY